MLVSAKPLEGGNAKKVDCGIFDALESNCCISLLLTAYWLELSHMITPTSRQPGKHNEACILKI